MNSNTREHIRYYSLCTKFKKGQNLASDRSQNSGYDSGVILTRGQVGTFRGDRNTLDFHLGSGYMGVKMCYKIHLTICIRFVYSVYVKYTSVSALVKYNIIK